MSLHLHPAVQLSFAIWANILMIAFVLWLIAFFTKPRAQDQAEFESELESDPTYNEEEGYRANA